MKKNIFPIIILLLLSYMLVFPIDAKRAASFGLLLWYRQLLPVLLPFSILSNILISTGILFRLGTLCHPWFRYIYPVSPAAMYPLIAGFLFGFPMGAYITSYLVEKKLVSYEEGKRILCISNNMGPGFILGIVAHQSFFRDTPIWLLFLLLYLPPLLLGRIWYAFQAKSDSECDKKTNTASRSQITFKIIDAGILNGFETLVRIGGYLMLFSILSDMVKKFVPDAPFLRCILVGFTEITTGIQTLSQTAMPDFFKKLLALAFLAFGGISGIGQTAVFAKKAHTSLHTYVIFRLICMGSTLLLSFLWFGGCAL